MKIERLGYTSFATNPARSVMETSDILEQSAKNNPANNITGALAFTDSRFVQVLEGSHGSLDVLLLKLAMDSRHYDMRIIDRIQISERVFGAWSMIAPAFTPQGRIRLAVLVEDEMQPMPALTELLLDMVAEQAIAIN